MVYPKFCVSSRYRLQVYTCFWIDKIKNLISISLGWAYNLRIVNFHNNVFKNPYQTRIQNP
jgi:hypothetical protein